MALSSYSKIHNLGHRAVEHLLEGPVVVEEKVDGSQISFGLRNGELQIRSKGARIDPDAPDQMFEVGVREIRERSTLLLEGFTYRGEYLRKPKHNTLAYDRVPQGHVVLFDVDSADQIYLPPSVKAHEAARIGFECVPMLHEGRVESKDQLVAMLERTSFLGGQKVEGVVVKAYDQFGIDGKVLMGKHVSEAFKEFNGAEYRRRNPTTGDIQDQIVQRYRSEVRWQKAVQHLLEDGRLEHSPRDIGALIKEVQRDVEEECADEIKEMLYRWVRQHVQRGCVAGLAEWYKGKLMERQFEDDGSSAERPPAGGELVMHPLGFPLEVEPTVVVDPDHNLWTTFDDDDWNGEACRIWILNLQGEHVRMTPPEGIDPGLLVRICAAVEEQAASSCVVVWSETSVS